MSAHVSPRPRRASAGFTFVEMMVVVLLISILFSVSGMAASADSSGDDLDLATLQARDTIERAQELARSSRAAFGVAFEVGGTRLALIDGDGNAVIDPLTKGDYVLDFETPGQVGGIGITSAAFGTGNTVLIFDPQGVPIKGGSVVLNCSGQTATLTVDAGSGRVTES